MKQSWLFFLKKNFRFSNSTEKYFYGNCYQKSETLSISTQKYSERSTTFCSYESSRNYLRNRAISDVSVAYIVEYTLYAIQNVTYVILNRLCRSYSKH